MLIALLLVLVQAENLWEPVDDGKVLLECSKPIKRKHVDTKEKIENQSKQSEWLSHLKFFPLGPFWDENEQDCNKAHILEDGYS